MNDTGGAPPQRLTQAMAKRIRRMIDCFQNEFGDQCSFAETPRPTDAGDEARDAFLVSSFGLCMKYLLSDDAMRERARQIPALESMAVTADEIREKSKLGEGRQ